METSKKQSSQRQIEQSIDRYRAGDLDCAITLAAAAEGMLPDTDDFHIFKVLKEHQKVSGEDLQVNLVINWLKHDLEFETATIDEFEAAIVIARAITKFISVFHESTAPFEAFLRSEHQAGHLPKLYK